MTWAWPCAQDPTPSRGERGLQAAWYVPQHELDAPEAISRPSAWACPQLHEQQSYWYQATETQQLAYGTCRMRVGLKHVRAADAKRSCSRAPCKQQC